MQFYQHLINESATLKEALSSLNEPFTENILFVIDDEKKLLGSLTDGDVRRGI